MYLAVAVATAGPSGIDEPDVGAVFVDLIEEEVGVDLGLEGQEGLTEACGEGGSGFLDSLFGSCDLGSVSGVEVVDGLFGGQFGDGGKD